MMRRLSVTLGLATAVAALALRAQPQFSDTVRAFIKVDAPVVALTNVRVIDGTGAPARANQTIIIKGGNIEAIGDTASWRRRQVRRRSTWPDEVSFPGS